MPLMPTFEPQIKIPTQVHHIDEVSRSVVTNTVFDPLNQNKVVSVEDVPIIKTVMPVIKAPLLEPIRVKFDPVNIPTPDSNVDTVVSTVVDTGEDVEKTPMEQFLSLIPLSGLALFAFAL
jgi:hypothetical protein